MNRRSPLVAVIAALSLVLSLVGCGSDASSDGANGPVTTAPTTQGTDQGGATTASGPSTPTDDEAPLEVLVSNDDGYSAEGIDVLVQGLNKVDGLAVTVYAPLEQQSATGGKSTDGELEVTDATTASGYPVRAIDGFPADSVRVALDDESVTADLVVTGINEGQNVGPAVDISGTVGAARAAVARDIPALATSQGLGEPVDYEAAVPFILDWIEDHRADLLAGDAAVEVTNLNVPSCSAGEVRGLAEVEPDPDAPFEEALAEQDCSSSTPLDPDAGDVTALVDGYATISTVPDEPSE